MMPVDVMAAVLRCKGSLGLPGEPHHILSFAPRSPIACRLTAGSPFVGNAPTAASAIRFDIARRCYLLAIAHAMAIQRVRLALGLHPVQGCF
jgi:hypothetical protein